MCRWMNVSSGTGSPGYSQYPLIHVYIVSKRDQTDYIHLSGLST